jgi:hypothetical protein
MNANIMNTQICMTSKVIEGRSQKVNFMFILTLTYVLMDNFLSLFSLRREKMSIKVGIFSTNKSAY